MKNTLTLSLLIGSSISLLLTGCPKDDGSGESGTSATTASSQTDGDAGDGDGDGGSEDADGDADAGDGDGDDDGGETMNITFVPDEDFAGVSECDPFAQDCPDGEKCVPYGSTGGNWDANKCVPVMGDGAAGDPCVYGGIVEATDDCDAGTHCWDVMDVDGMPIGVCTPFCGGTPDDPICEPGTTCLIANEGSITLCITACDPLLQDCSAGLACFWAAGSFSCIFTTQDIPLGEPCGFVNDCTAGLICLNADVMPECNGSACCGEYCSLSDPTCSLGGTECTPFFEEGQEIPGYEDVGVCITPGA